MWKIVSEMALLLIKKVVNETFVNLGNIFAFWQSSKIVNFCGKTLKKVSTPKRFFKTENTTFLHFPFWFVSFEERNQN